MRVLCVPVAVLFFLHASYVRVLQTKVLIAGPIQVQRRHHSLGANICVRP